MPQETLTFPPIYCLVGAYRLIHDPTLWKPMWAKCSKAAKQAIVIGLVWLVVTWPVQKLFVYYFMSASASVTGTSALYHKIVETADVTDDNLPFRIPVPSLQTFATLMFVTNQVHAIMEFWLRRKLKECRNTAYISTVRSRGKGADWWTEYVEEFKNPPTQKAIKDAKKQGWYMKLASPLFRFVMMKVFLLPMDFVPFFGMALGAALRSLTYGRILHKSFFEAKRMSPFQIELWITERQFAYRSFGFVAALMERIPLIGLVFSISNQIGAAMWAHDLEKRQQKIRAEGETAKEEYVNKPTLKKLYKEARDATTTTRTTADDDDDDVNDTLQEHANKIAPSRTNHFAGEGLAVLRNTHILRESVVDDDHGGERRQSLSGSGSVGAAMFTHLSFTFPLKLISPRTSSWNATRWVHQQQQEQGKHKHRLNETEGQRVATAARGALNDSSASNQKQVAEQQMNKSTDVASRFRPSKAVAALYIVGYGGGLVSGDKVDLDVDVGQFCTLLVLTQGSTKVFKKRTSAPTRTVSTAAAASNGSDGVTPASSDITSRTLRTDADPTKQTFRFLVRPNSTLILLPDPVTCFAASRYTQTQRFDVRCRKSSSLIVLDWITPGRVSVQGHNSDKSSSSDSRSTSGSGEKFDYAAPAREAEFWTFEEYRSRNEVRVQGEVVCRDILVLNQDLQKDVARTSDANGADSSPTSSDKGTIRSELLRRNYPYGCYATLILLGPAAEPIIQSLQHEFNNIQQRPTTTTQDVIWSMSFLEEPTPATTNSSSSSAAKTQNRQQKEEIAVVDESVSSGATIIRIAGKDSETVKRWLATELAPVQDLVGNDLYRIALV